MSNYIVQKGETLSSIGKKAGVDWKKITGYKSGDPNLIYPGEKLTLPDTAPQPSNIISQLGGAEKKEEIAPIATPLQSAVTGQTEKTGEEDILGALSKYITGATEGKTYREEKTALEEEKGVSRLRENRRDIRGGDSENPDLAGRTGE